MQYALKLRKLKMKKAILALILVLVLVPIGPCFANDLDEIYKSQIKSSEIQSLKSELPNETLKNLESIGVNEVSLKKTNEIKPKGIFNLVKAEVKNNFKKIIKPILLVTVVIIICAMFKSINPEFNKNFSSGIVNLVCVLTLSAIIIIPIMSTINYVSGIFKLASNFLFCYIPVITGLMLSNGQVLSSYVHSTFMVGLANVITQISSNFLVPFLKLLLAFAILAPISSYANLFRLHLGILKLIKIILGLLVTVFIGFFSIKANINFALEGAGTKSLKFLLGSCVPVVGRALGDATSAIKSCMYVLRGSASTFCIVSIVIMFLPSLVQCVLWYVTVNMCAILCRSLNVEKIAEFLKSTAEIMSVVLTVILCFLVTIIAATVVVMKII